MAYMEWTIAMSVGLPELDDDHKTLVRVINQLAENAGQEGRSGALRQCIFALMRYAEFHFAREEQVMKACGFPELPEHKLEHADFTKQIQSLAERFEADAEAVAGEVNEQLLEMAADPQLTPELNQYNLEFNLSPVEAAGAPFASMEAELRGFLDRLHGHARSIGANVFGKNSPYIPTAVENVVPLLTLSWIWCSE